MDANDIIDAAATQAIYDLTLGLSNKEKRTMVSGRVHEASAITFGEAKEGLVEAHNFSSKASITSTHSKNKKKWDAKSVALVKSLATLLFSIGTTTLKVTKEDTDKSKETENSIRDKDQVQRNKKRVAIEGMEMLTSTNNKIMTTKTGEEGKNEEMADEGSRGVDPANQKRISSRIRMRTQREQEQT
jgi:hypothetical protein